MTRGTLETMGADKLASAAPLRRMGDDDDLKGATLLFASAAGKHITGQILAVDGCRRQPPDAAGLAPGGRGDGGQLPPRRDAAAHHYLSLDPYMRMRMNDVKSYAPPQAIGEVMVGGTAGEVLASRHPKFAVGDHVVGMRRLAGACRGRRAHGPGHAAQGRHHARVPLSAYLGAVGMPGVTAWVGLAP
jgi:hypothetical protein